MPDSMICKICREPFEKNEAYYSIDEDAFCPWCYDQDVKMYGVGTMIINSSMGASDQKTLLDEFRAYQRYLKLRPGQE